MRNDKFELLAPAGSFETFKAVIEAGADAVYVGGTSFGARAYADNFSQEELLLAIDYAHLRGVKVYLTVNTLLKNSEIKNELIEYLSPFYERGLDAVLVQDFGTLSLIHKSFPLLPIHTSTQMTVTGVEGVRFLKNYGVTRVVMAREVSLMEMKKIHEETGMELEAFIHGALCYCYSGQCLFSSMLGGRSGNRGRCAQPCRLPYEVNGKNSYILSLKDMCGIENIKELEECGVYSLKIEGRMKKSSYAAGIVSIYRKYLDSYVLTAEDKGHIMDLGNRCGFTDSYYHIHNDSRIVTYVKPNYATDNEKYHNEIIKRYVEQQTRLMVSGEANIFVNKPISLSVSYGDITVSANGMEALEAMKVPLDEATVEARLKKTGDTDFQFESLKVNVGEGVFVPNGALNQLRRDALDLLYKELLKTYHRAKVDVSLANHICETSNKVASAVETYNNSPVFSASVETQEQLDCVIKQAEIERIYLPEELCSDNNVMSINKAGKTVYMSLPAICRLRSADWVASAIENSSAIGNTSIMGFLVKNYEELQIVKEGRPDAKIVLDHNMYTYNDYAIEEFLQAGADYVTVPLELNSKEIAGRNNLSSEMIIYGYYPLMTTAGCVHKNISGCDKTPQITYLTDRYKKNFAVKNYCRDCYNVIYNSLPTLLWNNIDNLKKNKINFFRFSFTIESAKMTQHILDITFNGKAIAKNDEFTNGHYKRGVE